MNNQVNYYIIVSDISTDNAGTAMNNNIDFINQSASRSNNENIIKTEPNDVYDANIEQENIIIKSENELKPKNEYSGAAILSTEKVIIKEELNIDEILYDESSMHNLEEFDPLADPVSPTEKFECKVCGENFNQSRNLDNHLFIMHRALTVDGTGAYCNKCNKWFTETKYPNHNPCFNYMRSIQNGKKMHSCDICDRDYTAIRLLKAHLIEAHRPRIAHESVDVSKVAVTQITCKICDALFPCKRTLIQHLTLMHRPYTLIGQGAYCTRCKSWFAEENFKDHRPCVCPQDAQPVFCCNICGAEFTRLHLFKAHMYVIHRPLALQCGSDAFCDTCNRWFKEDNYTMHKCFRREILNFKNYYCKYSCTICEKIFENHVDAKKHLYDVHRPIEVADYSDGVFCDFCKNTFDEDEFEGHVPCHSVDGKCVFCLVAMPSKQHYLLHDLTWKRWRSYQCNICDLNTEDLRLAMLNEHMMMRHGKKSIFRCVKCQIDFISTENAEAHIESIHSGCRCVMDPCVCSTYSYDYYYEFIKKRNIFDNKYLLENQIINIREEQYNSVESNIDVCRTRSGSSESDDPNNISFQIEPSEIINRFSMPSTSATTFASTIMEDVPSIPPGTSKVADNSQVRGNDYQQEIAPKTDNILLIESPVEKRRRLHGKSQKRRNQRRETRLKKEEKQKFAHMEIRDESNSEPNFDFVNIEAPATIPTAFVPEIEMVLKQKPGRNMHKKGDNERHEIFLARRRVYMQNYRRLKRQQPNTEEENEEEAAERRARTNERIRVARQKREALMSEEELLKRRAEKAEKVRLRRQMQREQLSEEELSQIRAVEAERKRMKRRQVSREQKQKLLEDTLNQNQLSEDEILLKSEKTDDDSSCLTNDEDQIVEQLRNERLKALYKH